MSSAEGFEEFVTIVDAGSVTAAADQLGLPRPTVSRRLARLEERLGVRLLHRTTRRLALTAQGDNLYPKARRIVDAARAAEAEVRRLDGVPRGLLRLSVPVGVPRDVFAAWLVEFLRLHPEVSLEVVTSSVHVDLVAEGFDIALRGGPIEDASLVARPLAHNTRLAVASPQYLAQAGTPQCPADLQTHNCIVGYRAGRAPELHWPLFDGGSVRISGSLTTNNMALRLEAAKRHLGIALIIDRVATAELSSGQLVPVLPGIVGRRERASLVYADRSYLDPKVRAFIDFLVPRVSASREERAAEA